MNQSAPDLESPVIRLIDDDVDTRRQTQAILHEAGYQVLCHGSAGEALLAGLGSAPGCIVTEIQMSGPSGLELQDRIASEPDPLPVVFLAWGATVHETLRAMKAGASDFLFKPVDGAALLSAVRKALAQDMARRHARRRLAALQTRYSRLSPRERQVLAMVVDGSLNKQISASLGAAERTIKVHRQHVMQKMEAGSLAELVRVATQLDVAR